MLAVKTKSDKGDLDIRPMRLGDRRAIEQFMDAVKVDGEEGSIGLEHMPLACHMAPTRIWIAKSSDAIAATICVTKVAHRVASIHGLYVLKEWRKTSLPLRMIITALEDGRSQRCQEVQFDPALEALANLCVMIDAQFPRDDAATGISARNDIRLNACF